jgi:vancomycin resistance protein YoaR
VWSSGPLGPGGATGPRQHNRRRGGVTSGEGKADATGAEYTVTPSSLGWTVDETALYDQAAAAVADTSRSTVSVAVEPESIAPALTTEQVQAAVDAFEATVSAPLAVSAGSETVTVPASVLRGWVRLEPADEPGEWTVVVEDAPIVQVVDELAFAVNVEPVNASYTFEGRDPRVVAAVDGQSLDTNAAVAEITDSLNARASGASAGSLSFSLASVPAEFTTEDAAALAGRVERLGRWTTHYRPSPFNGEGKNIRNPARLINGTVVQPGEQFDFIDHAGPFTKRNGYADGAAIINGKTQIDGVLGGGLCSASTTLFNAAMRAGLQIDARHNHSYFISRYPVGLDATIWVNGNIRKTLQFTNDTPYPILIVAKNATTKVTFEIWGVSDGRKVDLSKAKVEHKKKADTYMLYTDDLPAGETLQTEFQATGFDSTVTRVVTSADGAVLHENTWYSDYDKVNGIIKVGRAPGDPRAGTKILYEDWKAAQNGEPAPEE